MSRALLMSITLLALPLTSFGAATNGVCQVETTSPKGGITYDKHVKEGKTEYYQHCYSGGGGPDGDVYDDCFIEEYKQPDQISWGDKHYVGTYDLPIGLLSMHETMCEGSVDSPEIKLHMWAQHILEESGEATFMEHLDEAKMRHFGASAPTQSLTSQNSYNIPYVYKGHPDIHAGGPSFYFGRKSEIERFHFVMHDPSGAHAGGQFIKMAPDTKLQESVISHNFPHATPNYVRSVIDIQLPASPKQKVAELSGVYIDIAHTDKNITHAIRMPLKDDETSIKAKRVIVNYNPHRVSTPIKFKTSSGFSSPSRTPHVKNARLEVHPDDPKKLLLKGLALKGVTRIEAYRPMSYKQFIKSGYQETEVLDWDLMKAKGYFVEWEAKNGGEMSEALDSDLKDSLTGIEVPAYLPGELTSAEREICQSYSALRCLYGRGYIVTAFDAKGEPSHMIQTDSFDFDTNYDYTSIYPGVNHEYVDSKKLVCPEGKTNFGGVCMFADVLGNMVNGTSNLGGILALMDTDFANTNDPDETESPGTEESTGKQAGGEHIICAMGEVKIEDECVPCPIDDGYIIIDNQCKSVDDILGGGSSGSNSGSSSSGSSSSTSGAKQADQTCDSNEIDLGDGHCFCSLAYGFTVNENTGACECSGSVDDNGVCRNADDTPSLDSLFIDPAVPLCSQTALLGGECEAHQSSDPADTLTDPKSTGIGAQITAANGGGGCSLAPRHALTRQPPIYRWDFSGMRSDTN